MAKIKFEPISEKTASQQVDCGEIDIQELMADAYYAAILKQAVVINAFVDSKIAAQVMLKTQIITDEDYTSSHGHNHFSCIKIEYLAVEQSMQHQGIGTLVLKFTIKYIKDHCQGMPIRFILIESVQDRVEWYLKIGFSKLAEGTHLGHEDAYTVPMCIDLVDWRAVESYQESI